MEVQGSPQQPAAGWYPNPEGAGQRYWGGSSWSDHFRQDQPPQPQQPQAGTPQWATQKQKQPGQPSTPGKGGGFPDWAKWVIGGVVLLAIIGSLFPSEDSKDTGSDYAQSEAPASSDAPSSDEKSAEKGPATKKKPASCGTKATDDCTPHVGPGGSVRVDALVWNVTSAKTAATLGDQEYGLGAKADGVFVIVNLKATSKKDESATLTSEVATLQVDGGNTYKPDNDGTVAAIGAGDDPFFLEDIGPDSTITGLVVFDVPRSVLGNKLEVSFGELGFGSTKGYIRLPQLAG